MGMSSNDQEFYRVSASVAPEMCAGGGDRRFDAMADVWSWGVLFLKLLIREDRQVPRIERASFHGSGVMSCLVGCQQGEVYYTSGDAKRWEADIRAAWGSDDHFSSLHTQLLSAVEGSVCRRGIRMSLVTLSRKLEKCLRLKLPWQQPHWTIDCLPFPWQR